MEASRFGDLRGVQWRIDLGILPLSTIDHLRRVTADSRRRYASLRRQLLIDPHGPKDGSDSPDLVMDNPLSQNPDSMWGRFFRNAELEKMVDKDLSRLYPEHGSYFQTPNCQAMLRRILLLWCLRHPEYGYRQGMHELLAPLLYVLQADTEYLSEVRNLYEDHFADKFDGFSFHENDLTYKFDFKKFSEDDNGRERSPVKTTSLSELDPKVETVILSTDAYGAEGELGILISEKFMEHDAYCMFDALMSGAGGAVAMAEFFSHSRYGRSHTGYSPVIEASAALYHLLSQVDSPLHSHLVELGVEPQYFALRWLRVLFGREFVLEDLLIIWDEIFACDNKKLDKPCENDEAEPGFGVLNSSRGAFISAFAVAMILHLRSSLLATENATTCLQRLLNFPDDIDLGKLIAKAKSLQALAVYANNSTPPFDLTSGLYGRSRPATVRGHSHSVDLSSPTTPLSSVVPESYWEEKWRVLLKEQESKQNSPEKQVPNRKKGWSEKIRARLTRTESDPTPSAVDNSGRKNPKSSVRKSLLKDLAQQLGADDEAENIIEENIEEEMPVEQDGNDGTSEQSCSSGSAVSEQNSSIFSDPPSPFSGANEHDNRSERSSVASNCSADENDAECNSGEASCTNLPLPIPDPPQETLVKPNEQNGESGGKVPLGLKERKPLSGKFQWLWKLGRNGGEGTSEKGDCDSTKARNSGNNSESPVVSSTADTSNNSGISKGESVDQNLMVSLRNLGQSMLENIQVIESVFQQERGQENISKNAIVGKGQVTAMTALKELRKISNLLSEM